MGAKYDPLRAELEAAPADEPVSYSFSALDKLVGGLPESARVHRPWRANTAKHNRPHALAWLEAGRRVSEVRLGEAVVFSPAGAAVGPEAPGPGSHVRVLDGVTALSGVIERAGYASVTAAVAAHSVFLDPATVAQTGGKALFRLVRDPGRRGQVDVLEAGQRAMFDDNMGPTLAFLWSAQRSSGPDVQYNHVWGDPRNLDTYTALWNLCVTPAFLAKTTDGSNHPEVVNLLRYLAMDIFGHVPHNEAPPERPAGYEELT